MQKRNNNKLCSIKLPIDFCFHVGSYSRKCKVNGMWGDVSGKCEIKPEVFIELNSKVLIIYFHIETYKNTYRCI